MQTATRRVRNRTRSQYSKNCSTLLITIEEL